MQTTILLLNDTGFRGMTNAQFEEGLLAAARARPLDAGFVYPGGVPREVLLVTIPGFGGQAVKQEQPEAR